MATAGELMDRLADWLDANNTNRFPESARLYCINRSIEELCLAGAWFAKYRAPITISLAGSAAVPLGSLASGLIAIDRLFWKHPFEHSRDLWIEPRKVPLEVLAQQYAPDADSRPSVSSTDQLLEAYAVGADFGDDAYSIHLSHKLSGEQKFVIVGRWRLPALTDATDENIATMYEPEAVFWNALPIAQAWFPGEDDRMALWIQHARQIKDELLARSRELLGGPLTGEKWQVRRTEPLKGGSNA